MTEYTGICIGGPRDGQWVASLTDSFEITVFPAAAYCEAVLPPVPYKRVTYRLRELEDGSCLWVCDQ